MEFNTGDVPGEGTDRPHEFSHCDSGGGSDLAASTTAAETGLSAARGSALDHVPQVAADEGITAFSVPERVPIDRLVQETVGYVDGVAYIRSGDLHAAESVSEQITALEGRREALTNSAEDAEQKISEAIHAVRSHVWRAMPKAEDGLAHGSKYVETAVVLTPSTVIESPDIRAARVAAAKEASGQIWQGVQTVVGYYDGQQPRFLVAVPEHDGFAVGQEEAGDNRFLVGINGATIPADEAWVAGPVEAASEGDAVPSEWGVQSRIGVAAGEQVQPYLQQVSEASVDAYAQASRVLATQFRRHRTEDQLPSPAELADAARQQYHATTSLVGAINAASEAGVPLYDGDDSAGQRGRAVTILTHCMFDRAHTRNAHHSREDTITIARALAHIYPTDGERSLTEHLLSTSHSTVYSGSGHDRFAIVRVLHEVVGMERDEAYEHIMPGNRPR